MARTARCAVLIAMLCAASMAAPQGTRADVVLNEILFHEVPGSSDPMQQHEWVELHNDGLTAVDLTGWVLTDRDGTASAAARALPPVLLPPDGYLVVNFAAGATDLDFTDGAAEYYTGDPAGVNLLAEDMDEVGVYAPSGSEDFIGWHRGDTGYVPGQAHDDAVAAGGWTAGDTLETTKLQHDPSERFQTVEPGTSIGRELAPGDDDSTNDWDTNGGSGAGDVSPGRKNFFAKHLVHVPELVGGQGFPLPRKRWTVMLYLFADNNLEIKTAGFLKRIEAIGGSDANVNVVVMIDGRSVLQQATVDVSGLTPIPGREGDAWRFQIGPERDPSYVAMYNVEDPWRQEVNMGASGELSGFLTWALTNFPADRTAVIISGHGLGWQRLGGDCTTPQADICDSSGDTSEFLYMGELRTALDGRRFDLIGFDACTMATIEVAHQVQPFAAYMVASQDVEPDSGWPYMAWVPNLKTNAATWDGRQLGSEIVERYHEHYPTPEDPEETLSLIDLGRLPSLVEVVSAAAVDLRQGVDDFVDHDTPDDNVQMRIKEAATTARRFKAGHIDLRDLASLLEADGVIPACYRDRLAELIELAGPAPDGIIIAEQHGTPDPEFPRRPSHGLSIYMPGFRANGYDAPDSRQTTPTSRLVVYAPNIDQLPLQGIDEDLEALNTPTEAPRVPSPNLHFPADTFWDEFLQRYYHPTADAHIQSAVGPGGEALTPVFNDPDCGNPVDEITVPRGSTVTLSAIGSSDADLDLSMHWMWDFDDASSACQTCTAPWELNPRPGPPAHEANDGMDGDHDASRAELNDEREADANLVDRVFNSVGDFVVTLNVWDDIYQRSGPHDLLPSAEHVHIQTDNHTVLVRVFPAINHFQCYEAHAPVRPILGISLVDAMGPGTVDVREARRLCTPASRDGTDPTAPTDPDHLVGYTIRQAERFTPVRDQVVDNVLGTFVVDIKKPDYLMVPSAKSVVGPPGPPAGGIDHYKCHRISGARYRASGVSIDDQFGHVDVNLRRPRRLCLAATKNDEPVLDPGSHLLCFQSRLASGSPFEAAGTVYVQNQFGPDSFDLFRPTELCVPSRLNP